MTHNPEQLFELFYKNVTFEMNPPGMPKWQSEGMKHWWRERFMNALYGVQESRNLRSWAEAPQMWLVAYREFSETPTIIYEVGTFEQYEAGFHAFYRTTCRIQAQKIKQIAISLQPESDFYYLDTEHYLKLSEAKDQQFQQKTGKKFNISDYSKEMYEIQIREVEIDA
ncbi:hypothetical protein [Acinetobacter seifertii]|uniref:Uncharacterized protein n=1 Tax=Acinetobacter seifertii TaxID=1530123 RepID=A0A7H2PWT6_9GAMM|nr:hypothetical protein [Acinetobacter seifertii]QNX07319.1 hypothetical protein IC796_15535 [Acinetobacter seifertii]